MPNCCATSHPGHSQLCPMHSAGKFSYFPCVLDSITTEVLGVFLVDIKACTNGSCRHDSSCELVTCLFRFIQPLIEP